MPKATKKPQRNTQPKSLKSDIGQTSSPLVQPSSSHKKGDIDTYIQPTTKPNYDPIAPIHFEELSNIWESDRRIPTIASRTHWALARKLNPINVNSWWYRRKAVAKKFKIKIPSGTYELEVGVPPLVVVVVVKSEELSTDIVHVQEISGSDANSGSGDTLAVSTSSTCVDFVVSNKDPSGCKDTCAYIHDSEDVILATDSAPALRDSSPLPPSSPDICPSSPLPPASRIASPKVDPDLPKESTTNGPDCILVLDHDFSTSSESWKRIDLVAELDGPFEEEDSPCLLTPFQTCQWSQAFLSFYTFPTWCFAGLRAAYDGSAVCDCLCSNTLKSCSGETGDLDALVLTDEPLAT